MMNLYDTLKYFAEKAEVNVKYGYDSLVISDSKYDELCNGLVFTETDDKIIGGIKIIKKSEADKFMDLSQHWKDDNSIFLFKPDKLRSFSERDTNTYLDKI